MSTNNNNNDDNNNSDGGDNSNNLLQHQQQDHQQQDHQQTNSDISAMDDVQFSASLDALLNGDNNQASLSGVHSNEGSINSATLNAFANHHHHHHHHHHQQQHPGQAMQQSQQLQQLQQLAGNPCMVSAIGGAPGQGFVFTQQPQQQQQQQQQHLDNLPLSTTNQSGLPLVPHGAHNAAQMSLSAGHAAATGVFHPGNPTNPTNTTASTSTLNPTGQPLPQQVMVAAPFPWAISSHNLSSAVAAAAAAAGAAASAAAACQSVSSSVNGDGGDGDGGYSKSSSFRSKRPRSSAASVSAVSEDEGDRERRRHDRNVREQQRSHKITEQIAELREVLASADQQFKPDKYSTLTKVVEYIKQLQERSKMLDVEHKKLIDTISETNEIVNQQYVPAYTSGTESAMNNDILADGVSSSSTSGLDEESMAYVHGLDYKIAFQGCGIPMALTSIDGRFLDCNNTFLEMTKYSREELLPLDTDKDGNKKTAVRFSPDQDDNSKKNLSLFNLLSRDGMEGVFHAMSEMLKQPGSIGTTAAKPTDDSRLADFWSGPVKLCRQNNLPVRFITTCRSFCVVLFWMIRANRRCHSLVFLPSFCALSSTGQA